MRIAFFILASVFCSCNHPVSEGSLNANASGNNLNTGARENIRNLDVKENNLDTNVNVGSFKVDVYEDNELIGRYFYVNRLLKEKILPTSAPDAREQIIKYYYKENGEYDRLEITKGQDSFFEEFYDQQMQDFQVHREVLTSKDIKLPLATDVLSSEVSDLANVFSVADNYDDFKTDTRIEGNKKIIKFTGFNKRIGFERYTMTFRSGSLPILIKDYELILENNYPSKELYKTDEGELTKEYLYKDKKIIKLVYKFIDNDNQTALREKRFDYHELK